MAQKKIVHYIKDDEYLILEPIHNELPGINVVDYRELPLVSTQPQIVTMYDNYYLLNQEGIYRFFNTDSYELYQTYYFSSNFWYLLGGLSQMHVHGWRDDIYSNKEKTEKARRGRLSTTCGPIANFINYQLNILGLKSRLVHVLTLEEWDNFNNGHTLIEVFDTDEKRWLFYDSDIGCRLKYDGRWLNLGEACCLYRKGLEPEIDFPFGQCQIDPHADGVIPNKHLFYSLLGEGIFKGNIKTLHRWYKRILQIPIIDGLFPSDIESETLRAVSYANGQYAKHRLSWHEWEKTFY